MKNITKLILGLIRSSALITVLTIIIPLLLLSTIIPIKTKGATLSGWLVTALARAFVAIMPIQFECTDPAVFKKHTGFIFPNHDAFLDAVLAIAVRPVRFLAAAEVAKVPFVGAVAKAIGTVFVNREDKASRQQARTDLVSISGDQPIVLFPEGKIDGKRTLSPFRYGAFEIAQQAKKSILPAVFIYEPFEISTWHEDGFVKAAWRLAQRITPVKATLMPMETIGSDTGKPASQIATETESAMSNFLIENQLGKQ